jgi:hypothetical protein
MILQSRLNADTHPVCRSESQIRIKEYSMKKMPGLCMTLAFFASMGVAEAGGKPGPQLLTAAQMDGISAGGRAAAGSCIAACDINVQLNLNITTQVANATAIATGSGSAIAIAENLNNTGQSNSIRGARRR